MLNLQLTTQNSGVVARIERPARRRVTERANRLTMQFLEAHIQTVTLIVLAFTAGAILWQAIEGGKQAKGIRENGAIGANRTHADSGVRILSAYCHSDAVEPMAKTLR